MSEATQSEDRILIVGCGYLGQRVAQVMREQGWQVSATTRSEDKAAEFAREGVTPIVQDVIRAPVALSTSQHPLPAADAVLWAVGFDRTAGQSRHEAWVEGVERVIRRLDPACPPRIFCLVSSVSVYGDRAGEVVDESSEATPSTESGAACLDMERRARRLLSELFPHTHCIVLRLAGIYGPGRLLRKLDQLRDGTPLAGDGTEWLNLIHVDDAAQVIRHVLQTSSQQPVINVVSPNALTRGQYYAELARLTQCPPPRFADATGTSSATDDPETNATPSGSRQRSGNKRVVSRHNEMTEQCRRFDDHHAGLKDAVDRSEIRL
jgi:nucleoside-diphosphate-sugar epimerase